MHLIILCCITQLEYHLGYNIMHYFCLFPRSWVFLSSVFSADFLICGWSPDNNHDKSENNAILTISSAHSSIPQREAGVTCVMGL